MRSVNCAVSSGEYALEHKKLQRVSLPMASA
jgi:hypothetical protein